MKEIKNKKKRRREDPRVIFGKFVKEFSAVHY